MTNKPEQFTVRMVCKFIRQNTLSSLLMLQLGLVQYRHQKVNTSDYNYTVIKLHYNGTTSNHSCIVIVIINHLIDLIWLMIFTLTSRHCHSSLAKSHTYKLIYTVQHQTNTYTHKVKQLKTNVPEKQYVTNKINLLIKNIRKVISHNHLLETAFHQSIALYWKNSWVEDKWQRTGWINNTAVLVW